MKNLVGRKLIFVWLIGLLLAVAVASERLSLRHSSRTNKQQIVIVSSSGHVLRSLFDGIVPNPLHSWKTVAASAREANNCEASGGSTSTLLDKLMGTKTAYAQSCTTAQCSGSFWWYDTWCCDTCMNGSCTSTTKQDFIASDEHHGHCRDGTSCANGGIPCGCTGLVCNSTIPDCRPFE